VRFENELRRLRKAARSQGAYFGASAVRAPDAVEADFWWCMVGFAEIAVFKKGILPEVEAEGVVRRFFACESASPIEVKSTLNPLLTSFDDNEVVDLLPIPFRSALNLRFVAFIANNKLADTLDHSNTRMKCLPATIHLLSTS